MGTLIKLITTLWPFLREMIIKDKESQQFVERNKHSLCITTASTILFLLFCNSFIKNIQFSQMIVEARKESEYYKERMESARFELSELKGEHIRVRSALFKCVGLSELLMSNEAKIEADEEKPSPIPPNAPVKAAILPPPYDRKRLDTKEPDVVE